MAKEIKTEDLSNLEKIVLLGLDDKGWFGSSENTIKFGLAGMMLYEILQSGRAELEGKRIKVISDEPLEDPLEDKVLNIIRKEKKTRSIKQWIQRLAYKKLSLRKTILKDLMDKGVIRKEEYNVLMIFYQNKYPLVNEKIKRNVQDEIFGEVMSDGKIKASTLLMVSVFESCRMMKKNLKGRENAGEIIKKVHGLLKFSPPLNKKTRLVKDINQGIRRGIVASRVSIHA